MQTNLDMFISKKTNNKKKVDQNVNSNSTYVTNHKDQMKSAYNENRK